MRSFLFLFSIFCLCYSCNESVREYSVSEVVKEEVTSNVINVKGRVKNNFKLFLGVYELEDINTRQSIVISTKGKLPKIGSIITVKLKRNDVITINDKTFSLFQVAE